MTFPQPHCRPRAEGGRRLARRWHLPFHARFAWSAARWQFMLELMQQQDALWIGDLAALAAPLRQACSVVTQATLHPHYASALACCSTLAPVLRQFRDPAVLARSFSQFWIKVHRLRYPRTAFGPPAHSGVALRA